MGVKLHGSGFMLTPQEANDIGLGRVKNIENHIKRYYRGRDLAGKLRDTMVIDLFDLTERQVQMAFPEIYQWVYERVKPSRDQNNRKAYRDNWWIYGEPRASIRPALANLNGYIATVRTAKHRIFTVLEKQSISESEIVIVALDDYFYLGILSARIHVVWALAVGTVLGPTPRYNNSRCFDPFPFPDATEDRKSTIRNLAEQLDAHRKRQQALHPKLTLTDMYNVLAKLRAGEPLTAKDQTTHTNGLVSVLKQLHDDLDAAVFAAYGWSPTLTDEEILEKLVALNAERAAEEARGLVRWLRPDYQAPDQVAASQSALIDVPDAPAPPTPSEPLPWPKTLAEQAAAVRGALVALAAPASVRDVAAAFKGRATKKRLAAVQDLLDTLVMLGQSAEANGRYSIL